MYLERHSVRPGHGGRGTTHGNVRHTRVASRTQTGRTSAVRELSPAAVAELGGRVLGTFTRMNGANAAVDEIAG
jgi:hypothetical protein